MTDEFDVELRGRLDTLSAAVPVDAPGSTIPVSARVRPGRTGQRLAIGGLVPLVAIIVLGTVAAGLLKLGPFAPAATGSANGPVVATATDGPFELTIRSAKARYAPSEPIEIDAALVYRGEDEVTIGHAQGADVPGRGNVDGPDTGGTGGPLGFGIVEPVIGDLVLAQAWAESCERTALVSGVPLTVPFAKSGAFSNSNPRADQYRGYLADPILRLDAGTWHVYTVAEFSEGHCGGPEHRIRIDLAIEVLPESDPPGTPRPDEPTPPASPFDELGQVATDRDGDFQLTLRSGKTRYAPDEAIDVTASLVYLGPEGEVEIAHDSGGAILFGSRQRVYGEIDLGGVSDLTCARSTLHRNVPLDLSFRKSGGFSGDHPNADMFKAFMMDPVLRLPAGTWHLYAVSSGACMAPPDSEQFALEAEIAIVVSDDPVATPDGPAPTPTPLDVGDLPIGDDQQVGPWQVTLTAPHRRFSAGDQIDVTAGLGYWGEQESVETYGSGSGRIIFGLRRIDVEGFSMGGAITADCGPHGALPDGELLEIPFEKSVAYSEDDPNADFYRSWFEDPVLRLPPGTWEFVAITNFTLSADCRTPGPRLTARIVINVTE